MPLLIAQVQEPTSKYNNLYCLAFKINRACLYHYKHIAERLNISEGQLCNIIDKCGCKKIDHLIYSEVYEQLEQLVEELTPWNIATILIE